jgi:uncharacterized protein
MQPVAKVFSSLLRGVLVALVGFGIVGLGTGTSHAVSTGVVVSQVYGSGGNSGATHRNDFIELFNRGTVAVSLSGWSVQYGAQNGTTWTSTNLPAVTLQPGQYFLIQEASGGANGALLPTPDATGTLALASSQGKVAVVSSTTLLSGACPSGGSLVDLCGYGLPNCSEGTGTANLSTTTAAKRNTGGCQDSDNNAADFTVNTAATPRNTATAFNPCIPVATEPVTWSTLKVLFQ